MNIEEFKNKLIEEKESLEADLNNLGIPNPNRDDDWFAKPSDTSTVDTRDEVAERMEEMGERKAMENTLEPRLRAVNLALKKIDEGNYGHCEICNEEIDEARLNANPAARTCREHFDQEEILS